MSIELGLLVACGVVVVSIGGSLGLRHRRRPRDVTAYELVVRGERRSSNDAGTALASTLAGHKRDRCAIWRFHEDGKSRVVLVLWHTRAHRAIAEQLARAVGAIATEIDLPDLPVPRCVAQVIRQQIHPHHDRDAASTENQVPGWLAHAMGDTDADPSAILGVSLAWLGHPPARIRRWLDHEAGIDRSANAPRWQQYALVSMVVGGSTPADAAALARGVIPLLPGVPLDADPVVPHDRIAGATGIVIGALLGAGAVVSRVEALWAVAAGACIAGLWWMITTPMRARLRRSVEFGTFEVKRPRLVVPTKIHPTGLVMTPVQAAALVAPPHSGDLGAEGALAPEHAPPPSVRGAQGAGLGKGSDGLVTRIDEGDRWRGIFVSGDAGAGKSTLLLGLWGQDVASSGAKRRAHIWIETKGEGAARARAVAPEALCIEVGAATGPRLDLLAADDPEAHAMVFVDALRYAFGERSISWSSRDLLIGALSLAMCPEVPDILGIPAEAHNPLRLARLFLGAVSQQALHEAMAKLAKASTAVAATRAVPQSRLVTALSGDGGHLERAVADWAQQLARRASEIRALMTPPANKLHQLELIGGLWTPGGRSSITFDEILRDHRDVIIDLGTASADRDAVKQTAAIMLYLLWQAICARCGDWRDQGQAVRIYSDELSDVAGAGADDQDVLGSMVDQGRSRGVELAIGTQRLDQIPEQTRHAALALGAKIYLSAESPLVADLASADLGGAFSASDLRHLPPYTAAVRMRVHGQAVPPFSLHVVPEDTWQQDADAPERAMTEAENADNTRRQRGPRLWRRG